MLVDGQEYEVSRGQQGEGGISRSWKECQQESMEARRGGEESACVGIIQEGWVRVSMCWYKSGGVGMDQQESAGPGGGPAGTTQAAVSVGPTPVTLWTNNLL